MSGLAATAAPAPDAWSFWQQHDNTNQATIDHSTWQRLLDQYVRTDESDINLVDYVALAQDGRDTLTDYLSFLTSLDPRTYNREEQFAYWVNLYNALTIEVVLRYPKKNSILRMGKKFFSIGPWDDKLIEIAGQSVTLNDIEHRILRPLWQDHRIHYAVNCASLGCPNLSKTAFTATNLEEQLTLAEARYTNHPRGVKIDGSKVRLSSIYKWYRDDFGDSELAVLQHLSERNPDLLKLDLNAASVKYDYNWTLNRQQ